MGLLHTGVLSVVIVASHAAPEAGSLTGDQLLQLLNARDLQVDNICLHYTTSASVKPNPTPSFDTFKLGGLSASGDLTPVAEQVPTVIEFQYNELMIVRGKEVTFDRTIASSDLEQGDSSIRMLPRQKWSNRGNDLRELTDDGTDSKFSKILEYRPKNVPVSMADEQRMEIEFALGFGFGSRIKTIDSLRWVNDAYEATGKILVWWADVSTFRIRLDKDLIVRHAEIDSDVAGNLTRFEVNTTGTSGDRVPFAKSGHFVRRWMGLRKAETVLGQPDIRKEFSADYKSADWDLSDNVYLSLVSIEADDNTQVIDHTGNHAPSYINAKEGGDIITTIIIMNVVAICVVVAAWFFRTVNRQRRTTS